jgi:hypothetical protein
MGFLKAWARFPRGFFRHIRVLPIFPYFPYFQVRIPPEVEQGSSPDAHIDTDEPLEPLADAEISEAERQEAVRRYKRELKEKGRR